ncbi:MAG: hypothetical protein HY063_02135 [Bacteroidetes bacterium]|nr:hypothetical protein [Bacteroidota bacterium]
MFSEISEDDIKIFYESRLWKKISSQYFWLPLSQKYYNEYYNNRHKNLSIVIYNNHEPVLIAICFSDSNTLSYFHFPFTVHFLKDKPEIIDQVFNFFFNKIDALKNQGKIFNLRCYYDEYLISNYFNNIVSVSNEHYGIIDLALPLEIIKSNIRKSYKSLINWGERNLKVNIMNKDNADKKLFDEFKNFHLHTSGRQTRNDVTWELQYEMIKQGGAYLTTAFYSDNLVSANLFLHGTEEAFYSVAVNDRSLMAENISIAHYPIYHSISYGKQIGLKKMNMDIVDKFDDEKKNNISKFKKGFTNRVEVKTYYTISL